MTMPTHACPRCAHTRPDSGACPRGHGWLLDLSDRDDRDELSAHAALLRAPRAWGTELRLWLAFELTFALAILGLSIHDEGMTLADLAAMSPAVLVFLGGAALFLLLWRRAGPRAWRARRIETLLARTPQAPRLMAPEPATHLHPRPALRVVSGGS